MKKVYSFLCALLVGTASLFAQAPAGYMEMGAFSESFTDVTSGTIKAYKLGWGWQNGSTNRTYTTSTTGPVESRYICCSASYTTTTDATPQLLVTPMLKGTVSVKVKPYTTLTDPSAYAVTTYLATGKSWVRFYLGHKEGNNIVFEANPFMEKIFTTVPVEGEENTYHWVTLTETLDDYQFVGIQMSYAGVDLLTATSYCIPENRVLTPVSLTSTWTDSNPVFADGAGNGTWTGSITVKNEGNVDFAANEATLTVASQSPTSISTTVTKFTVPDALAKGESKTYELSFPIHNETASDGRTAIRLTSDFLAYGLTATSGAAYKQSNWFYLKAQDPKLTIKNASNSDVANYATSLGLVSAPASTTFTLKNDGGSPAVLNSITAANFANISWSEEFPLTIAKGETKTITLTFGNMGGQASALVFNYGNTYDATTYSVTSKDVSVVVADPSLYLEQFSASLPAGWINEDGSNWEIGGYTSNYYMQNKLTNVVDKYLISPKLHFEAGQNFAIMAQGRSAAAYLKVLISTDRSNWTVVKNVTSWASTGSSLDANKAAVVAVDMPVGDYYVAFASGYSIIDYVMGGTLADIEDDLYLTINGSASGMVNYEYTINTNIKNMLAKAYVAGDITIELLNGTDVVATAEAEAIAANGTIATAISFTPHAANAAAELTIKVKKGAEVLTSATKTINIATESLPADNTTGTRSGLNSSYPLRTSYYNSKAEWIYPASKIGLEDGQKIISLAFDYYNTGKDIAGDMHIYLQLTDDEVVTSTTFTDVTTMTEVFSEAGHMLLKEGYSSAPVEKKFTFAVPFIYQAGKNLRVVMACEHIDTYGYGYQSTAWGVESKSDAMVCTYSDSYTTYAAKTAGSYASYLPVAKIGYAVEPPTISGKLTDNQGNALANQEIIARSGDIIYSANTDAEGNYSIEVMQADKIYNMNIMVLDAEYTAIENIILSAGSVADQDITHPADHIRANLTVGKVGTICLPYNAIATEGATFYKLIEKDAAGKNIIFESVDVLEAGHAYIYESEAEMIAIYKGSDYEAAPIAENGLIGTYDGEYFTGAALADKYYFSQNKVWPAAGLNSLTVGANRAYIDWTDVPAHGEGPAQAPGSRRYVLGNGAPAVTTAVENINADENASKMMINGQIYILRGENMYDMTGRLVK